MSIESMAVVLHHAKAKGTAKLVLLGIANHDGDGGAWPSHRTLASYANVDVSNVKKAIRALAARGEVVVHPQAGGTRDWPDELRPNLYTITVRCPPWCDRSAQHRDTRAKAGPQLGLGIEGGADTPPGGRGRPTPRADTPPGGGAVPPPKPPTQPDHSSRFVTEARARPTPPMDYRPCQVCGHSQAGCELRQVRLAAEDQHPYSPPLRVVAPIASTCDLHGTTYLDAVCPVCATEGVAGDG